jgi:hypothetical protein
LVTTTVVGRVHELRKIFFVVNQTVGVQQGVAITNLKADKKASQAPLLWPNQSYLLGQARWRREGMKIPLVFTAVLIGSHVSLTWHVECSQIKHTA